MDIETARDGGLDFIAELRSTGDGITFADGLAPRNVERFEERGRAVAL
ncbi:hypothetical protein [Bradyrhizobium elkanii]|nr:hypothetical protein [Bradyrhizobium elkanii]MBR1165209.1 hypothetical protein [Bradyrhizobium elkanii]